MENSLKNKTVKGTFWSAIERFSSMGVQIVCTSRMWLWTSINS